MPIAEVRVRNFRAFQDSGRIAFGPVTPITGRNDAGKSGLLHALRIFFDPPKKGLDLTDIHGKNKDVTAEIEVAFTPSSLASQEVQIDAKNKIHLTNDCLVDKNGLLRIRLSLSIKGIAGFHALIQDVDDAKMFPLATKDHDQLLALLSDHGLPAVKAGKETNQQKRDSLRQKAQSSGIGVREEWADIAGIEPKIRSVLPELVFFEDTANFAIGETSVQNQFRTIVDKALGTSATAKQIEDDARRTIQGEFDKVFERLQRLTDSVTSLSADTRVSWKKAVEGIGLEWGDAGGTSIPFDKRGAGVRRLFMVAYFQYESAEAMHAPNGPKYVFAVEEPEVHLHPGAQRVLDEAFRDLADRGHAVVFTSHSPVFASMAPLRDVVLVRREDTKAVALQVPSVDAADIASELGVEASDRLVGQNYVVLVEGKGDVGFYENALAALQGNGDTTLDPKKVLFLQCGGVENLRFMATTRCMDKAGLRWAVIVDSDRPAAGAPPSERSQRVRADCPKSCSHIAILDRTSIENYLDAAVIRVATGIDCEVPAFGRACSIGGAPLAEREWLRVKASAPDVAARMGHAGLIASSQTSSGKSELVAIFEAIRLAFGL